MAVARLGVEAEPPKPPPRGLMPLLRFTRLPDRALAAARKAVDDDHDFRRRVRDATTEAVVGRPAWLFLDRPEGWSEELSTLAAEAEDAHGVARETKAHASLGRRVDVLEATLDRATRERERLEAELALVKGQLVDERRARRLAESDAGRRRREADSLAVDVDDLRRHQVALRATLEGVALPPPVGVEDVVAAIELTPTPLVDHARLAELIADGAKAAVGLSRVLAEAGRELGPALNAARSSEAALAATGGGRGRAGGGPRRRPSSLPPGTFDDSVEAAGHLVRMAGVRVLVDGYNVTKSARPALSLFEQRQWLADAAAELAARTGARVELVFDGADDRASAPADLGRRLGVQLRYSAEGTEADDALLELVEELPVSVPVVVASDDRRVRDGAQQRGANVLTTSQLLTELGRPPS